MSFNSLYETLDRLIEQIITANLDGYMLLAQSLGALGALLYIAYRVWRSLANAEPIDVFPLLRPFVLGLLIMNFTWVTEPLNDVIGAISQGTETLCESNQGELEQARNDLQNYIEQKLEEMSDGSFFDLILGNTASLRVQVDFWIMGIVQDILQWLLDCAKLLLYTVSSFMLLILTLLGPIVFAFAIFDGFQASLVSWISRYIHLSLWLPVANILNLILNSIEIEMCRMQLADFQSGKFGCSYAMIVFYIIGLVAFTTVPTVSGWIVEAGGGGGGLTRNLTSGGSRLAGLAGARAGAVAGGAVTAGATVVASGAKKAYNFLKPKK